MRISFRVAASLLPAFSFLLATACVGRTIEYPHFDKSKVKCGGTRYFIPEICSDERDQLALAARDKPAPIEELDDERLATYMRAHGIERAAAYFYLSSISTPRNRRLHTFVRDRTERYRRNPKSLPVYGQRYRFVFVPGMFYGESQVDATGKSVRALADHMELIPVLLETNEVGTIDENAGIICKYLAEYDSPEPLLMATVSKGGSDLKRALQICGDEHFEKVRAWVNIGGLLRGSNVGDEYAYGGCLGWQGLYMRLSRWKGLYSLRKYPESPLLRPLQVPEHIMVLNVVGVPLKRHVSLRSYSTFLKLAPYGPNDGYTLLPDSIYAPGYTYAAWRSDHYFRSVRSPQKLMALFTFVLDRLEDRGSRSK